MNFAWDQRDGILDYAFAQYTGIRGTSVVKHNTLGLRAARRNVDRVYSIPTGEMNVRMAQLEHRCWDIHRRAMANKWLQRTRTGDVVLQTLDDVPLNVLSLLKNCTLKGGALIKVGSHTVTHPLLSAISVSQQQDEIQRSKSTLEEIIGQRVTSFAYPYGNYKRDAVAIVREAGFDCACSTIVDTGWRRSDPFQLPRVTVENWDGEEFLKRLSPMLSHNKFV